ncbi:molybdopterin molybdotransferase MoeA [Salinimonas marina]|uniref:Molybdopterin molybdenumtransferase n=1 Tax=Salinimonas marina TaxID=2785918 RepID=A0A7S9DV47_9ALTE|nr:gephyrin-like molybdotransferase Glp [Salinimonas marina]QPG04410.1 molybdopterin molybdotransferase MoeA [Salinimonas marina]
MASEQWLSLPDARRALLQQARPVAEVQNCPVVHALGRIVAENIYAPINVPPLAVSAMDGYALAPGAVNPTNTFEIVVTILAGQDVSTIQLKPGQAARIMTGAGIPDGADRVVMQENTTQSANTVQVGPLPGPGENIRAKGNDIACNEQVVSAGVRLKPAHLMLLSSLGIAHIRVYRKLNVALLATGDELRYPGDSLSPGQIYNSNSVGIAALLQPYDVNLIDLGIVADKPEALKQIFKDAMACADILISSGGVSVGEADHVKSVLQNLGRVGFWKVAMKPGKPFAFGHLDTCLFCGVPGNPVSAYVTTEQLVVPLIQHIQGEQHLPEPLIIEATLTAEVRHRPGRAEFVRAQLAQDAHGRWQVAPLPKQSSGVMTTVTRANAYLLVPADSHGLACNTLVSVQPFDLHSNWSPSAS